MSTPCIQRGPMTAEVLERDYTRIGNRLLRDRRLSFKAKGIFTWMASHKDGFGVSPESIAAAGTDGISAVKSALRELEEHGYLTRSQVRAGGGKMGATTYRITDMPSSGPEVENRPPGMTSIDGQTGRSEPVNGNPPADEPPAVNHLHKKTIPLQEDHWVEDELSLPAVPAPRTEPDPVHERETPPSIDQPSTAQRVVRTAGVLAPEEEAAFIAWAATRHQPRSSAWWRTVAANGDLPDLVADWRAQGGTNAGQPLTGTDATVMGWLNLADQLRREDDPAFKPSVTDQRVRQALNVGRQMQAEADARRGGYRPQNPNDAWDHLAQQAAAGQQPDGWETVPFCGHLDCDEITRMRQVDIGNGLKSLTYCSSCHPALQF